MYMQTCRSSVAAIMTNEEQMKHESMLFVRKTG